MLKNKKDGSKMLLVEDNGGGMDPDKMRSCMSLGYSSKSKMANTIGQYGNGFKTSTMRLGADVIVFSQCPGKDGKRPTRSIGLLSYTFLTETGKQDIVVPMVDYEQTGTGNGSWTMMKRGLVDDWYKNLATIVQWSPYTSEAELLEQFNFLKDHGTRIVIYNLWEDDEGKPELDFEADQHDIQVKGVNRDEKNIEMAESYPNSRHFLTYRHSLRSYASILYLRLPTNFRMVLRGKDVEHHDIEKDMMFTEEAIYKPKPILSGKPSGSPEIVANGSSEIVANVRLGFVKDAAYHIDVQGFNVYHKNRLIKPFWRLWNASGSSGRGVLGVLEANFVEPAHDKQGFERTVVLSRLEAKLISMQKEYWFKNCHLVGYSERRNKKNTSFSQDPSFVKLEKEEEEGSPSKASASNMKANVKDSRPDQSEEPKKKYNLRERSVPGGSRMQIDDKVEATARVDEESEESQRGQRAIRRCSNLNKDGQELSNANNLNELKAENVDLRKRLERYESLELELKQEKHMREEYEKEQDILLGIAEEERKRRDEEEERLRKRLEEERERYESLEMQMKQEKHMRVECEREQDDLIEAIGEERKRRDEEEEILMKKLEEERERCESVEGQLKREKHMREECEKDQDALVEHIEEERKRRDEEEERLRKRYTEACARIEELAKRLVARGKRLEP